MTISWLAIPSVRDCQRMVLRETFGVNRNRISTIFSSLSRRLVWMILISSSLILICWILGLALARCKQLMKKSLKVTLHPPTFKHILTFRWNLLKGSWRTYKTIYAFELLLHEISKLTSKVTLICLMTISIKRNCKRLYSLFWRRKWSSRENGREIASKDFKVSRLMRKQHSGRKFSPRCRVLPR